MSAAKRGAKKRADGAGAGTRGCGDEVGRILAEQFFSPGPSSPPPAPVMASPAGEGGGDHDGCGCGPPEDLAEAVRALPELDALPELKVTAARTPSNGIARPSVRAPAPVPDAEGAGEKKRRANARGDEAAKEKCAKAKPEHYKVVCISLYTEDLARLDEMVVELKRRGFSRANRSSVLRLAVEQLDLRLARKGL